MTSWGESSLEDQLCLHIKIGNQDDFEVFISYDQLMDFLEQHSELDDLTDVYFKFRGLKAHQGPLDPDDNKGSSYNLLVEWETGEVAYETLTQMSMDDPIFCAEYGKNHNLLDKSGCKRL